MILYRFSAFSGSLNLIVTTDVTPGDTDLFSFIRYFGTQHAKIGRYRRLDLNPDSPTHGHHLFENGTVTIDTIHKLRGGPWQNMKW